MSRRVNTPATVQTDPDTGVPVRVDGAPVLAVLDHWREWIGILQSEPERDVWRVELARGICELHKLHLVHSSCWLLAGWED